MSIWIVVEHRAGEVREVTGELIAAARALNSGPVTGVVLGGPAETQPICAALPASPDAVLVAEHAHLAGFNGAAVAEALRRLAGEHSPALILGAHSAAGMDWAPTLAAGLRAPVVTDATSLVWENGALSAERAVYAGKLQARVRLAPAATVVATLRPGSQELEDAASTAVPSAETVSLDLPVDPGKRFLEWLQEAAGAVDIGQADFLVSVGRGIGDKENLDIVEALAEALGATVSCSRPVVDAGWLPKDRQVGVSGKTVKPKVYLALGISGAFQHLAAMKDAALIVAVNKDPRAPIFRAAHYGIVGDLFKVVPAITKALRAC